jgi:hypothetical protein
MHDDINFNYLKIETRVYKIYRLRYAFISITIIFE